MALELRSYHRTLQAKKLSEALPFPPLNFTAHFSFTRGRSRWRQKGRGGGCGGGWDIIWEYVLRKRVRCILCVANVCCWFCVSRAIHTTVTIIDGKLFRARSSEVLISLLSAQGLTSAEYVMTIDEALAQVPSRVFSSRPIHRMLISDRHPSRASTCVPSIACLGLVPCITCFASAPSTA